MEIYPKFVLLFILIASTSQGDIFKCTEDISTFAGEAGLVIQAIQEKNIVNVLEDIGHFATIIKSLVEDCQNPICLTKAFERCEAANKQGCEQWGALVYPKCAPGYYNVGCCLCSHVCPAGFSDQGLYCGKPSAYGRGVGYPWKFGDPLSLNNARARCEAANPTLGCSQWGLVIYPNCKAGFHNVACCVCSPNCPAGWTDIGVSCKKPDDYGRGVGYGWHPGDCDGINRILEETDTEIVATTGVNTTVANSTSTTTPTTCDPTLLDNLLTILQDVVKLIEIVKENESVFEKIYQVAELVSKIQFKC